MLFLKKEAGWDRVMVDTNLAVFGLLFGGLPDEFLVKASAETLHNVVKLRSSKRWIDF